MTERGRLLRMGIAALAILASALAGCGGRKDSATYEASAAPVNHSVDAPAVEGQSRTQPGSSVQTVMRLEPVGDRFNSPVYVTSPPGDPRLFVVEQAGRIRVVSNGRTLARPFLDIASRVKSGGEQGLLSMAFHPEYRTNGWFFVNFTDVNGDTHIERFKVSSNSDVADPASYKLILKVDQPFANHNGGLVMFGLDGMLYVGMGDGGSAGDPHSNGQNPRALLGKMLRINVSRAEPYTIPVGNPYANGAAGAPEVWAIGLRNPWRFAFDRAEGLIYIGDVGQNRFEEVDVAPATAAGLNYGWSIMEGDGCYRSSGCKRDGLQAPVVSFDRSGGVCSVIGGFVYRGRKLPQIAGHYFYSDYCAGWLKSFRYQNGRATDRRTWQMEHVGNVVSFGEDAAGEIYIVAENGRIFRFAAVA